ncbi:putative ATP-binding cassette transporter [Roseimicrobium gellanilyticum]|uniref:Putative ATP-binding cassette transporter n=1 Tax=Roseimicrobium gellanilyticum TaxID=748857 RepID=A0A366HTT1_9BACT|nr:SbmA/BacA-like family transporter [Roseimicrobium gellanilyticum]RBP47691.1 putative ATP-binding cassette transporter [Roseimicrobium gellanilyticum]
MTEKKTSLRTQVFRRLLHVTAMFFRSPVGGRAWLLAAALLVLMLCINGMNVLNSFVGRDFMSSIEAKDRSGFVRYAWMYAGVFATTTIVAVFFRFVEERLGLLWRDWLTHRVVRTYMDERIYLHLDAEGITNPDQRMTEDIRQLTTTTLSFLLMILNGTMTAISFSGVLWTISPTLFMVAVLYAIAGSTLTILLGRPLIRLNYQQADYEANFRSELIHVRENADGIALTANQNTIRERLMGRIDQLVTNFRRITAVNRNLGFFTTGYNYMIQLIPTLLVAPLFMNEGVDFGVIGQSAMAFATLVAAFSLVVTQFQAISAYASVVTRLGEFVDASERAAMQSDTPAIECLEGVEGIKYSSLDLQSADKSGNVILGDLNALIVPGRSLLVHGANQAARVAFFRASAGIHSTGSGTIARPPEEMLAFLPEQPYLPAGTAREVLVPSGKEQEITNRELQQLFAEIGLASSKFRTPEDFEIPRDWHDALSLSKQQLMSVARVLLARPKFVFLDNLGSVLSTHAQNNVLAVLAKRGITSISIGEEDPDPTLYDTSLELREDGSWKWTDLKQGAAPTGIPGQSNLAS